MARQQAMLPAATQDFKDRCALGGWLWLGCKGSLELGDESRSQEMLLLVHSGMAPVCLSRDSVALLLSTAPESPGGWDQPPR